MCVHRGRPRRNFKLLPSLHETNPKSTYEWRRATSLRPVGAAPKGRNVAAGTRAHYNEEQHANEVGVDLARNILCNVCYAFGVTSYQKNIILRPPLPAATLLYLYFSGNKVPSACAERMLVLLSNLIQRVYHWLEPTVEKDHWNCCGSADPCGLQYALDILFPSKRF